MPGDTMTLPSEPAPDEGARSEQKRIPLYRIYLSLVSLSGVALFLGGLWQFPNYADKHLFLLLCGLAAVSALTTISVQVEKSGITYSVGPAVSLAVIPHWGLLAATLVSTGFNGCLWLLKPKDQATWKKSGAQLAFNNGMHALAFVAGGAVLLWGRNLLGADTFLGQSAPWLLATMVYNEVNLWLLIGVLRLQHGPEIRPWAIWKEERWASQISILVLAFGGGVLSFAIQHYGAVGITIFYLPIGLSAYAFRLYVNQMQEHMLNLENIVAERTRDLAELNRQKDSYLALLTHDMMTPITSIQLCADELNSHPSAALEDPSLTTILLQSQKTLLNIVHNILDIEKLQTGGSLSTAKVTCDLAELLDHVASIVQIDADARGLHLTHTSSSKPLLLYADRQQLERILLNLLSNAVKYTPAGGHVAATAQLNDRHVVVEVRDTGYGIPAQELPHIFERFHRGERLQTKAPGAGLGLAITKALVEEHGGDIIVQSEEDKGTVFIVRLPLLEAPFVTHNDLNS